MNTLSGTCSRYKKKLQSAVEHMYSRIDGTNTVDLGFRVKGLGFSGEGAGEAAPAPRGEDQPYMYANNVKVDCTKKKVGGFTETGQPQGTGVSLFQGDLAFWRERVLAGERFGGKAFWREQGYLMVGWQQLEKAACVSAGDTAFLRAGWGTWWFGGKHETLEVVEDLCLAVLRLLRAGPFTILVY